MCSAAVLETLLRVRVFALETHAVRALALCCNMGYSAHVFWAHQHHSVWWGISFACFHSPVAHTGLMPLLVFHQQGFVRASHSTRAAVLCFKVPMSECLQARVLSVCPRDLLLARYPTTRAALLRR